MPSEPEPDEAAYGPVVISIFAVKAGDHISPDNKTAISAEEAEQLWLESHPAFALLAPPAEMSPEKSEEPSAEIIAHPGPPLMTAEPPKPSAGRLPQRPQLTPDEQADLELRRRRAKHGPASEWSPLDCATTEVGRLSSRMPADERNM